MGRTAKTHVAPAFARTLSAARLGSREALGRLFESCRPWLMRVASRALVHDRAAKTTAADCVQDTFLEAQRDFDCFTGRAEGELLNWLRRILLHNLADHRRRYATRTRDSSRERPLREAHESAPAAVAQSPDDQIAAEEQLRLLHAALAGLPRDYLIVIRLRNEEQRSFAEIARVMRKPSEDAARKLWTRAVRSLRDAFPSDAAPMP